jgi:hypothetical protein
MFRSAWRARLLPFPAPLRPLVARPLISHGAHVAIAAEFGRRPHPARVNSEAACLARARGACFPSHQHLPDIAHSAPPSPACPSLPGSRLTGVGDGHKQWHAAWRTHSAMGSQWARPPATRNPSGDAITDCEPMLVALSRSNMFAHTRANGHERLIEHTVVPQKSSSNPAFPCSALRIKAFPSSPIKLVDSLYRDADRKVVHTGGILPHWPSARHVSVTNQSLGIRPQTYSIFVSAPLTRRASAIAVMPSAV